MDAVWLLIQPTSDTLCRRTRSITNQRSRRRLMFPTVCGETPVRRAISLSESRTPAGSESMVSTASRRTCAPVRASAHRGDELAVAFPLSSRSSFRSRSKAEHSERRIISTSTMNLNRSPMSFAVCALSSSVIRRRTILYRIVAGKSRFQPGFSSNSRVISPSRCIQYSHSVTASRIVIGRGKAFRSARIMCCGMLSIR